MPDEENEEVCERESVQIRFSVSREWVDQELLKAYPAVTNRSDAARTAVQEAVQARREEDRDVVMGRIGDELIDALERQGGTVSNNQSITINDPESVAIEGDDVEVVEEGGDVDAE